MAHDATAHHRRWRSVELLRLMLAWRLQAEALGGLDRESRRQLKRRGTLQAEGLALGVGTRLRREWQGRLVEVEIEDTGFPLPGDPLSEPVGGGERHHRHPLERAAVLRPAPVGPVKQRCALYTRKSSEEGLDQQFNSLDAQREACEAFVKSQTSEGRRSLATRYDDGGVSGGSMQRPALKRLLADIAADQIEVVVVYKIDRLTRSLADFARMVELFDRHRVSFVSVTQAFNTTSSMGRLTLNVLLSFAQFEREVTGERIRDKISASKAKGMWMGGTVPLGYEVPTDASRALVLNEVEATTVRTIFKTYLELGSVPALQRWLDARGIRSKRRTTRGGRVDGRPALQPRRAVSPAAQPHLSRHDRAPAPGSPRAPCGNRRHRRVRHRASQARCQRPPSQRPQRPGRPRTAHRAYLRYRRPAHESVLHPWPARPGLSLLRVSAAATGTA